MKNFILPVLCVALLMSAACKKEQRQEQTADRATSATIIVPTNPTLSGVLGTGHRVSDTIRLTANTAWRLDGLVYVDSADVLQVDPCSRILCLKSAVAGVPGGGLVICRGAKIIAEGTANCPIVFTSNDTINPKPGDWAGIVLVGDASSNDPSRVRVPGLPFNAPLNINFGGPTATNNTDNSGILKYVRIEYAGGFQLSAENEINGLTLAGVGSGTTIDYVEVFKSADDAFQFYGGTVNVAHLIACDATDDLFETTSGYRGSLQYILGLADTTLADPSQSNGIVSENNATGSNVMPLTNPDYRYVTIIGVPNWFKATNANMPPSRVGRYGRAAYMRGNTDFVIDRCILMGYNFGCSMDVSTGSTAIKYRANHVSWIRNCIAHAHSLAGLPIRITAYINENNGNASTGAGFHFNTPADAYNYAIADGNLAFVGNNPNMGIQLTDPFNRSSIFNFAPVAGSPGWVRGAGAFPGGINWATGSWPRFQ